MIDLPDKATNPDEYKAALALNTLEVIPRILNLVGHAEETYGGKTLWEHGTDLIVSAATVLKSEFA
jgi:hypothetical protein